MILLALLRRQWLLALVYFVTAVAAVSLTRLQGTVAFVWPSTAILLAALLRTRRANWWAPLAVCGAASLLVTGLFGLGWAAAVPFAFINLFDAAFAAFLFRRLAEQREPMQSLGWYYRFVAAAGLAAPIAAAVPASLVLWSMGANPVDTFLSFYVGHALGNLAITPIAMLLTGRRRQRETVGLLRRRAGDVAVTVAMLLAASLLVFGQSRLSMLFLPVMVIVLATFRLGRVGAAIGVVVVAVVGGLFTAMGEGPIQIMHLGAGGKIMFFQFYLALTVLTVIPVSADLHHRRALFQAVRMNEERFRLIAEHSSDLLMHIDADGRLRYVSPSIRSIAGHDPEALVGKCWLSLVDPDHGDRVRAGHQATLAAAGDTVRFEFLGRTAEGISRWFETHSRALFDEQGRPDGVLSIARDIDERKARETSLTAAALTDALTGLPNRRAFEAKVAERGADPRSRARDCIALLDLDHFKRINDLHGHEVGDAVLRGFADVARQALRQDDLLARYGGEEFVVLFPDTTLEEAARVCERLRRTVAALPIAADGLAVRITVSGGVAGIGAGGLGEALKVADLALYQAKAGGRDQLALAA